MIHCFTDFVDGLCMIYDGFGVLAHFGEATVVKYLVVINGVPGYISQVLLITIIVLSAESTFTFQIKIGLNTLLYKKHTSM